MSRKSYIKRELLSLTGQLQHACKVARYGRIILFLRRMINQSVVKTKDVESVENGSLGVGDPCKVTIKKGSKTTLNSLNSLEYRRRGFLSASRI